MTSDFYEVRMTGHFCAAHAIRFADGSKEPTHGHNFHVTVTVRSESVDPAGFAIDFLALKPNLDTVLGQLNNTDLNQHPDFRDPVGAEVKGGKGHKSGDKQDARAPYSPSAEMIARWIFEQLGPAVPTPAILTRVDVEESPGCWGSYGKSLD